MLSKSNIVLLVFLTAIVLYFAGVFSNKDTNNMSIGGDFTLTSHTGERMTSHSFDGKARLVYFGYTYCPDICPTALANMQEALEIIRGDSPVGIFITVDPQRDTQEQLAVYMQNFPKIIGFTGSSEEIKAVANDYRVYYKKVENKDSPEDYTMDHSSLIYLMDEKGKYMAHFAHTTNPKELAARINKVLQNEE